MKAMDVDAIFDLGVFKPSQPVSFQEGQKVRLSIEPVNGASEKGHDELRSWTEVFDGLTDEDISDIERVILDRSHFVPDRISGSFKR